MPSASGESDLTSWEACELVWQRGWRCTTSVCGSIGNSVAPAWLLLTCWDGDLNSHQAFKAGSTSGGRRSLPHNAHASRMFARTCKVEPSVRMNFAVMQIDLSVWPTDKPMCCQA